MTIIYQQSWFAQMLKMIVGLTGSGKSTIIKLILRIYDINSGLISLDGISIKEINLKSESQKLK